jgi:4-amino-4-deoxy-L-arabinose transferase-like glycosyltransferase
VNRIAILAAAIVVLICLFSLLGAVGFVGPDEPRYAWIARSMSETGDWVTPRLYGRPWFEKPILYYWIAAIGFRLRLPAEWAARLPSALAALAAALAIGWLGRKHDEGINNLGAHGPKVTLDLRGRLQSAGLWAAVIFSTSVSAIGFARAAGPDMLFSAALALAMASGTAVLRHAGAFGATGIASSNGSRSHLAALALFGASLGLSVLAKGPAGVILAAGAIGTWALATKQWSASFRLAHPIAIAAFLLIALPWYALCAARNPDFLRIFIFQHNFQRYLTNEFQHRQPFWFFLAIILVALLPWTSMLVAASQDALHLWRGKSAPTSQSFFFACWAIFPVLFFSVSQSKLPGYVLPAIPPACLVIAITASKRFRQTGKSSAWIPASFAAAWIAVLAALLYQMNASFATGLLRFSGPLGLLTAAIALAFAASWRYSAAHPNAHPEAPFITSAIIVMLFVELAGRAILPTFDPLLSARSLAALASSVPTDQVAALKLRRSWQFGLNFYLHRELPEWTPADATHTWIFTNAEGAVAIAKSGREITGATSGLSGEGIQLFQVAPPNPSAPNEP